MAGTAQVPRWGLAIHPSRSRFSWLTSGAAPMKRMLVYVAVWAVLAIGLGALVGSLNVPKLRVLAADGIKTQGAVLALGPANHRAIRYSYQANDVVYSGIISNV